VRRELGAIRRRLERKNLADWEIGEEPSKATNLLPKFQVRGVVFVHVNSLMCVL